ncbi:MAG: PIN domain-containing protein [Haloferacaceae archaeon]
MDTSALMMPVECGVRVFEEVERLLGESPDWATPAAVVAELDELSEGGGTEATAASVGRDLAERCRVVETDASYADDALVELAARGDCEYVVTNDLPLRDRLLERGVRVIGLRGRNTLHIQER